MHGKIQHGTATRSCLCEADAESGDDVENGREQNWIDGLDQHQIAEPRVTSPHC